MSRALRLFTVLLFAAALGGCSNASGPDVDAKLADLPPGATWAVDDASCPPLRCFEVAVPLPDGVRVTDNRVRVILPPGYADSTRRYPELVLLHDAPGDYLSWTRLGEAMKNLDDVDVIAIMPDGGGGNPGWYSNWRDGEFQWETYHIEVMLPWLESHLRVLGDGHRAIAGPSMGGFGAMSYAARHPGLFAAAAGFSGAVDFLHLDRISALYTYLGHPVAGTPNGPIWGDPVTNYDIWLDHDPGTHVDGLAGMKIFLACGNGLPGGPHEDLGSPELYGVEVLIQMMNQSFAQTLADAGVEHQTWFYGPGYHNWPYYKDSFAWALPQLMDAIR
jgi:diacylglycerol O-acyltransferase/trehalose O-mycolyltransferase